MQYIISFVNKKKINHFDFILDFEIEIGFTKWLFALQ